MHQNTTRPLVSLVLPASLLLASAAAAATRQVPSAYPTIQAAINAAADGDLVLVEPGAYHERIDFLGKEITVRATEFVNPSVTVIDADLLGTAVTIGGDVGPDAKLVGFTIRDGSAVVGGGLAIDGDPTIRFCKIVDCDANLGAGAHAQGNPTFDGCTFQWNEATRGGAALVDGVATVLACTFVSNVATVGGALSLEGDATITDSLFLDNAATSGSSVDVREGTSVVDRCRFADADGSDAINVLTGLRLRNSTISGGDQGVYINSTNSPVDVRLANVTIWGSAASSVHISDGGNATSLEVVNSILWDAPAAIHLVDAIGGGSESIDVRFSNVAGGWSGPGNIDQTPLFEAPTSGDFRLRRESPCIDAGSNAAVPGAVTLDIDGLARFVDDIGASDSGLGADAIVDMGAHERPSKALFVDDDATGGRTGLSWADAFVDLQDALDLARSSDIDYILVAEGTYSPDRGTGDRDRSFELVDGDLLLGGFAGDERFIGDRDHATHATILSGAIGADGTADNSYHVVTASNCGSATALVGFIVQRGNADGAPASGDRIGGGMQMSASACLVRDCWFRQNAAASGGGAIQASNFTGTIDRCRFNGNESGDDGSAISLNVPLNATIANCLVHGNEAAGPGAVALLGAGQAKLINLTIADNVSTSAPTGGLLVSNVFADLSNCILWMNVGSSPMLMTRQLDVTTVPSILFHCTVEGWMGVLPGFANDDLDPLFVNPLGEDLLPGTSDDNFRLAPTSPAIDAGLGSALPPATYPLDVEGNERRVGTLDRGAYEFAPEPCIGDLDGNGAVDASDIAILLGAWGGSGVGDVDGSGTVNAADLASLLGAFGPC